MSCLYINLILLKQARLKFFHPYVPAFPAPQMLKRDTNALPVQNMSYHFYNQIKTWVLMT